MSDKSNKKLIKDTAKAATKEGKDIISSLKKLNINSENEAETRDKLTQLLSRVAKLDDTVKQVKDLKKIDHKFWKTQPVPKIGEEITESGFIESNPHHDDIRKEPFPLSKEFEWYEPDTENEKELKELYQLLSLNYVEDDDASFRFDYSAEFLKWALLPPNQKKSWLVAVRVVSNKKLVAFISGIPVTMRTHETIHQMTEINFLCVHKKLRSKRLAPVLIKEITRRSHLEGIFQAVYTAGVVIPKPVATCRYYHRSLNPKKLVECHFSHIDGTIARMTKRLKVPEQTETEGLREMREQDVPQVRVLLNNYLSKFELAPVFETDEDVKHWILPHKDVVWSYVVENKETKEITDFFSFYSLPSTVIGNPKHSTLNAAYLFYYGIKVNEEESHEQKEEYIKKRLNQLIADALVLAKKANFDVVNTLMLLDNDKFIDEQKFGKGDGLLNFYLYNWRCPDIVPNKIGLVML